MSLSSTRVSISPLPDGANVLKALQMLMSDDPIAGVFAKGVLKAFGVACPAEKSDKIQKLLTIWDAIMPQQKASHPIYHQEIIDQARVFFSADRRTFT